MAKTSQATKAKRNRKRLLNFFRRTFSGLKKLAVKASKLPAKANKAVKRAADSIAKAAHSQSKTSPAAARERMVERAIVLPPNVKTDWTAGISKNNPDEWDKAALAVGRRLKGKPVHMAVFQREVEAEQNKAKRARDALKSIPTKITVPAHERKGTKGVTQHERKTTTKEKNQMAAQKLIDGFNADYGTRKRTNNQWAVQCLSFPDRPQNITTPLDKETAQQMAIEMNKEEFKDGDRYGIKAHDPWKEVEGLTTQPTRSLVEIQANTARLAQENKWTEQELKSLKSGKAVSIASKNDYIANQALRKQAAALGRQVGKVKAETSQINAESNKKQKPTK
jgi:hypothetical protein